MVKALPNFPPYYQQSFDTHLDADVAVDVAIVAVGAPPTRVEAEEGINFSFYNYFYIICIYILI